MLADYGSLFRAGKYQYLAERMSKLECDVQADGLRAYCADDVELRIVHRSIATGNAVKAVESRMASDFGPVDLEENLKKSKQIQEDAPYLKRAADGFPTMRVIRKAITRQAPWTQIRPPLLLSSMSCPWLRLRFIGYPAIPK